jgi:hypothetical protein
VPYGEERERELVEGRTHFERREKEQGAFLVELALASDVRVVG